MKYKGFLTLAIAFVILTILVWKYSNQSFIATLEGFGTWVYGLTALFAAYQITEELKKNRISRHTDRYELRYTKLISLGEKLDFIVAPEPQELLNNINEFRELLAQSISTSSKTFIDSGNNFLSSLDDRLKLELNNIQDAEEKSNIINKFLNAKRDFMHEIFEEQNKKHYIFPSKKENLLGVKVKRVINAEIISAIQNIIRKKSHIISHLSEARKNNDLQALKHWVDIFNKNLDGTRIGKLTLEMDEYGNLTINLINIHDQKQDKMIPYRIVQFLNEGGINNIFGFEKALEIKMNLEHKFPNHDNVNKKEQKINWKDLI